MIQFYCDLRFIENSLFVYLDKKAVDCMNFAYAKRFGIHIQIWIYLIGLGFSNGIVVIATPEINVIAKTLKTTVFNILIPPFYTSPVFNLRIPKF